MLSFLSSVASLDGMSLNANPATKGNNRGGSPASELDNRTQLHLSSLYCLYSHEDYEPHRKDFHQTECLRPLCPQHRLPDTEQALSICLLSPVWQIMPLVDALSCRVHVRHLKGGLIWPLFRSGLNGSQLSGTTLTHGSSCFYPKEFFLLLIQRMQPHPRSKEWWENQFHSLPETGSQRESGGKTKV